ncbi:hypothetical protein L1887_03139 [Cichorium endivia]|nr:hypothetical protein L1887_03139 [Cichorium endivia]
MPSPSATTAAAPAPPHQHRRTIFSYTFYPLLISRSHTTDPNISHFGISLSLPQFMRFTIALGTKYFQILLQSNCGVSVLDFVPKPEGGSPYICLNRLNQNPSSPIASGTSAGRKASKRIVLVCHGFSQGSDGDDGDMSMDMLGTIQIHSHLPFLAYIIWGMVFDLMT